METSGNALDISRSGRVVAVAADTAGLQVGVVGDGEGLRFVGSLAVPGERVHAVEVVDRFAYVGTSGRTLPRFGSLLIVDVADPAAPTLVGSVVTPDRYITDLWVAGSLAFAIGSGAFQVIDVEDPAAPRVEGTLALPSGFSNAAVSVAGSGAYAYVAAKALGLLVIDVTDPSAPAIADTLTTANPMTGVTVQGDHAYACTAGALHVLDIRDPSHPVFQGVEWGVWGQQAVSVSEGLALVGCGRSGLHVYDVHSATEPTYRGRIDTPGSARTAVGWGSLAMVADLDGGIRLIDVSNPSSVSELSYLSTEVYGLAVAGRYLYVAAGDLGLRIVDVHDPLRMEIVASTLTPIDAVDVALAGSLAYVCDVNGLEIFDVRDPSRPVPVGGVLVPGVERVALRGDHAILVGWTRGLQIVDVSDPSSPRLRGRLDAFDRASDVAPAEGCVFVTDGTGLHVVDVTDPDAPRTVATVALPVRAERVTVSDHRAYVGAPDLGPGGGLYVVEVRDPLSPRIVAHERTTAGAMSTVVRDGIAYVADGSWGVELVDVRTPSAPRLIGGASTISAGEIVVDGPVGFVGVTFGIYSFPAQCRMPGRVAGERNRDLASASVLREPGSSGARFSASPVSPNPFRGSTTIRFELAAPRDVRLTIHDVAGRLVRNLFEGNLPAGEHAVDWRGTNESGAGVAGAVYFVELRAGETTAARKIVFAGGE